MIFKKSDKKIFCFIIAVMFSCHHKEKQAENIKPVLSETRSVNSTTIRDEKESKITEYTSTYVQMKDTPAEITETEIENETETVNYNDSQDSNFGTDEIYDSLKPEVRVGYVFNNDSIILFYNKTKLNHSYYVLTPAGDILFNFSKLTKNVYEGCVDGGIAWETKFDYAAFIDSYSKNTNSFDWKKEYVPHQSYNTLLAIGTADTTHPDSPLHFIIPDSIKTLCLNTFGLDSTGAGIYSGGSNSSEKRILVLSLIGDGFIGIIDFNEDGNSIRYRRTIEQVLTDSPNKWYYACQADLNNDGMSDIFLIYSDYEGYLDHYTIREINGEWKIIGHNRYPGSC